MAIQFHEYIDAKTEIRRPKQCVTVCCYFVLNVRQLRCPAGGARYDRYADLPCAAVVVDGGSRCGKLDGGIGLCKLRLPEVVLVVGIDDANDLVSALQRSLFYGFAHFAVSDECQFHSCESVLP